MFKGSHISIYATCYAIEKWPIPTVAFESLSSYTSRQVIKRKKEENKSYLMFEDSKIFSFFKTAILFEELIHIHLFLCCSLQVQDFKWSIPRPKCVTRCRKLTTLGI